MHAPALFRVSGGSGTETASACLLVCDRAGRYVAADESLLVALGYTLEELRVLPTGSLSNADPEASAVVWRGYTEGRIALPVDRHVGLVRKDGGILDAVLAKLESGIEPDTWEIAVSDARGLIADEACGRSSSDGWRDEPGEAACGQCESDQEAGCSTQTASF